MLMQEKIPQNSPGPLADWKFCPAHETGPNNLLADPGTK